MFFLLLAGLGLLYMSYSQINSLKVVICGMIYGSIIGLLREILGV